LSQVKIQENRKEESQIMSTLDALILTRSKALWFLFWVPECKLCAVEMCCVGSCKPLQ